MYCGSAGKYNVNHYDEAMDILVNKINKVKEVEPQIIIVANP